jgi:flagellar biogenesis protein FliO
VVFCAAQWLAAHAAVAADPSGSLKGAAGTGVAELPFPSVGRLVVGFLVTVGLAIGIAYAIRRWWPMLAARRTGASGIRTLDRAVVSNTLSVYVLEVEGARYLVAEGRGGVAVTRTQPSPNEPSTEPRP